MKPKILLSFLLSALTISAFAQKIDIPLSTFSGLDTTFTHILKEWHTAGFAIAVVDKDSIVYAKGFGYRDVKHKTPVTPQTLFAIGSCTKAFTSALIGKLQKEGKIDIDKPVRDYLPELKFYNTDMNDHITIRDMLCHRTGLPRHDLSWYLFPSHSRDSLLKRIQYLQPDAGVSKVWQYNNFMYMALGALIEKITGKSWEDNVKEELFSPIGMIHSDMSLKTWTNSGEAAKGYDIRADSIIHKMKYYDIAAMSPAGAINSNVLQTIPDTITIRDMVLLGSIYNKTLYLPSSRMRTSFG